jgi:hypothetical protein
MSKIQYNIYKKYHLFYLFLVLKKYHKIHKINHSLKYYQKLILILFLKKIYNNSMLIGDFSYNKVDKNSLKSSLKIPSCKESDTSNKCLELSLPSYVSTSPKAKSPPK